MTRRISWISWTQYHKVSFNFNSQHPHPPHQQLFISIQLPYISNGCDSRTGLFSKLPHKCEHYMNKCVYRSLGINAIFPILQVWEGQLLSPVKTTSPTFNTSEQIQSSSLQSRLSSCHCQWLHKLVKNLYPYSSSTNVPPACVDRLRWAKCSLWQNRSESPPNGPLMHHCTHKKEVVNSTWPLPQVK